MGTGQTWEQSCKPRPAARQWGNRRRLPVYGALDLGTNNCRMMIAAPAHDGFRVVETFSRIVRLGEGLGTSDRLSEAAMRRTLRALAVCARRMARRGVRRTRCVATEACRRAVNGPEFLDRVACETGLALEPISAEEEASLTLDGCAPLLEAIVPRALMFDIGGGSTELSWIDVEGNGPPQVLDTMSIPLGVVTLSEAYGHDRMSRDVYEEIIDQVDAQLDPFDKALGVADHVAAGQVQMLGTSGTVTTLGGIHLDLPRYDRSRVDGLMLAFDDLLAACARLIDLDFEGRAAHPCIGRQRADLVLTGCAVLEAVCRRWPVGRLRVADRGLREGLILGLLAEQAPASRP